MPKLTKKDELFLSKLNDDNKAAFTALLTNPRRKEIFREMVDNYNPTDPKVYEDYFIELVNDFPDIVELYSYIMALEDYCFGKLNTRDRKLIHYKAILANKESSGRPDNSTKITEKEFDDRMQLVNKYHDTDGDTWNKASKRAGFKDYNQFKYYKKKYRK